MRSAELAVILACGIVLTGCQDPISSDGDDVEHIDTRLHTHVVPRGSPSIDAVAYLTRIADIHERVASMPPAEVEASLREGLALAVPANLPEAEIVRLELTSKLCETVLLRPGGASVARDMLLPLLDPSRSLPLDHASARALVVLGDAAARAGDDVLAVGSYMRAIRLLRMLQRASEGT